MKHRFIFLLLPFLLSSCTYLKYTAIQTGYTQLQEADPTQRNVKHMIDKDTYFVLGKIVADTELYSTTPMAIAAYTSKFVENERVDTMYFTGTGTHYGLNLPEGEYTLLVFADENNNGTFDSTEIVATKELVLNTTISEERVLNQLDIILHPPLEISWVETIPMPSFKEQAQSLFFPSGTLRSLDDPIFDDDIATMGMYDPASFLEQAPTMFYALEEDLGYKIPVIFVHGIDGSSRAFKPMIDSLDRQLYKPWFFYYPSGGDLDQLADFFYDIFLSGNTIPLNGMPAIIVAHSMGGLIVREAINNYRGSATENKVELLFTIASPLGGHPDAAAGVEHGLIVLPAWRDLNPDSRFIKELYRKPLPDFVNHQLLYAYENSGLINFGENSDGVVPLSSQLSPQAQQQASAQFGFNSSHNGILENSEMIDYFLDKIKGVENTYSQQHLELFTRGGFDINLNDEYSPMVQYLIHTIGIYLMALVNEEIDPTNSAQEHFILAAHGETAPVNDNEEGLLKFMEEYPELTRP